MLKKIFPKRFDLHDKIVLVTGGTGLIGKDVVLGLAQANATVIFGDIDKKLGQNLEKKYIGEKLNVKWRFLDVTDESSIISIIDEIISIYGRIDVLVNMAYPRTKDWSTIFEEVTYDSWRKNIDMHLNSTFFCCQQVVKEMKKKKSGSIINFGSIYGVVGPDFSIYDGTNMTMAAAYSAIKGGIITFTRYLATYYGKYGIRSNVICPGSVSDNQPSNFVKNYTKKTPLARISDSEEIACPVIFLASDASSYITGHVLMVDGGWTSW